MLQNKPLPYQDTFNELSNGRKTTRNFTELAFWPDANETTSVTAREYWRLSSILHTVADFDTRHFLYANDINVIMRDQTPKGATQKNPSLLSTHLNVVSHGVHVDLELSRFACWATMKKLGQNMSTTFQQEYFLNPGATLHEICEKTRISSRIELRAQHTIYQKQLHGILNRTMSKAPTHIISKHHATLNRDINAWMFGGYEQNFREKYNIHPKDALADYMNDRLLAAYNNALKQIIDKWDSTPGSKTYETLRGIAYNKITEARTLFEYGRPEQNFTTNSISAVQKWLTARETEFAKKYINEKVR